MPLANWDEQVRYCTNQVPATHLDLPYCSFPTLGLTMVGRGTWGSAPSPQVTMEMVVMGVTESSHPAHADVVEDHTPAQYSSIIGIPMLGAITVS